MFSDNSEKTLRTLSTYQENIAWIKSSWYYTRNIEGDIRDNVPQSKYWGDVSPCPIGIDAPGHQTPPALYTVDFPSATEEWRVVPISQSINPSTLTRAYSLKPVIDTSTAYRHPLRYWPMYFLAGASIQIYFNGAELYLDATDI